MSDANDDGQDELVRQRIDFWKINRRAMGLFEFPLSTVERIEVSAGYERVDYHLETDTRAFSLATGREVVDRTRDAPACGDSLSVARDVCEPGSLNQAVASAGVGLRTNLLGFTAAEVHLVKPFDRDRGPFVSFSFTPAF